MSLQKPPKSDEPSRVVVRLLALLLLVLAAGVAVWTAVTNQRIDLVEDTPASSVELADPVVIDGVRINVVARPQGRIPVILLHDHDIAGSVALSSVAPELGDSFRPVLVDMPGYGLSDRLPEEGAGHTVSAKAETIASVIEERHQSPVVLVGVGLGGQVAAEVAATRADLVRGLVLVDVDFWEDEAWEDYVQRLPWVGRAATYTFSAAGRLGVDMWAPYCDVGGWCPDGDDLAAREFATSISGSTDTLYSFRRTLSSSLVPADLDKITVPVTFVHSTKNGIPEESIDSIREKLPDMKVVEVDAWQAHLEQPSVIVDAVETMSS